VVCNFQTGNNRIKLLTEYECVTHSIEIMRRVQRCQIKLSELRFHIHKQFYFVISRLKIMCHGNPDNNLESLCIKNGGSRTWVCDCLVSEANCGISNLSQTPGNLKTTTPLVFKRLIFKKINGMSPRRLTKR
jgi:hypothetical protein